MIELSAIITQISLFIDSESFNSFMSSYLFGILLAFSYAMAVVLPINQDSHDECLVVRSTMLFQKFIGYVDVFSIPILLDG